MTAVERAARTHHADELCAAALDKALTEAGGGEETGVALVAVGGYGRGELAPYSDLDVVLVHDDDTDVSDVAGAVWYPLWDSGAALDHSVRRLSDVTEAARRDARVALGLLDARHLAGDPGVTLRLRTAVLAQWRRDARRQLPAVRDLVEARAERMGELAHASVPDLKESYGGLRDASVLKALVATWLVDVPHVDLERTRTRLLDVRDQLHVVTGRAGDRVSPEVWADLAVGLGLADAEAAQRHVRELGRRVTHLSRLTWRRVDALLARPSATRTRGPELVPVARWVAVSAGEVVLDQGADPRRDPHLLLRAAAEASERGLALSPATAARAVRLGHAPAEPWDEEARNLFVRLLAGGPGLLAVWETLDETGGLHLLLPEWERIRLLPHASVVHRFTVDRHSVETCMEASRLIRRVRRPDLLVVAALLHDIGKADRHDHSVAGEPLAVGVARRLGFSAEDSELVGTLVRRHLLLAQTATTRDLEDPATVAAVAERVGDVQVLDLLEALTEADARATAPKAWTPWRAGLVHDLTARARVVLTTQGPGPRRLPASVEQARRVVVPAEVGRSPNRLWLRVDESAHGSELTVVSQDRVGLIADVAGALALRRVTVRSLRAWAQDDLGCSVWDLAETGLDEAALRQQVDAVAQARVNPATRLGGSRSDSDLDPVVQVDHEASAAATVLEVRAADRPGVVHAVCRALAGLGLSVRSAHVATLGPQAVDVFYVAEPGAAAVLADDRAAAAVHAVRAALSPTVTLEH